MRVACSFSASRVSCPQHSFTEASFTNYPAYLPYLLLMVKKNRANSSNEDNGALLYLCLLL